MRVVGGEQDHLGQLREYVEGLDVLAQLPEMVLFSSDYPHQEGNAEPIALYGDRLGRLDPDLRARFMGGTIEECYARTGDPL